MLVLPTGQVLFTDGTTTVQIYTASGTYQTACKPTISRVAATLTHGVKNNKIQGTQFNGLSQERCTAMMLRWQRNYPLISDHRTLPPGNVVYCKTHNHQHHGSSYGGGGGLHVL